MIADRGHDDRQDTGVVDDDPPATTPGLGMDHAVEPWKDDKDGRLVAPSMGMSGVSSGVMYGDDTCGMMIVRDDRMTDEVVRGARAKTVMVASPGVMDEDVLAMVDSLTAEPSVVNSEYPGKNTSKNLSVYSNSVMLEARTVASSASKPGVQQEDDKPGQVGRNDVPTKEVVMSPGIHRKCVHNKKGVCSTHGPGAKERWRPGNKVVSVVDGMKKYERTKIYFWECDLGSKGRKLQQTGISRFLSPARGRREGSQTVGEETLLGAACMTTEGQYSGAE